MGIIHPQRNSDFFFDKKQNHGVLVVGILAESLFAVQACITCKFSTLARTKDSLVPILMMIIKQCSVSNN